MKRVFFIAVLILFILCANPFDAEVLAAVTIPVPQNGAYIGLWASDAQGGMGDGNTTALETLLNKQIAIQPKGWGDGANCSDTVITILNNANATFHAVPMVHLNNKNRTLDEIANNTIHANDTRPNYTTKPDDLFRSYARCFKAYGKPLFVRIFSEMNWNGQSENQPWHVCPSCKDMDTGTVQTPQLLVRAWRRVHDIFAAEGATNVMFMWIQIPYYSGVNATVDYAPLYPGNAYVDWVGWDVYNNGQKGTFHSFYSLLKADYDKMRAIAPGKPMIIPEFNSYVGPDTTGKTRAAWFTAMLTTDLPHNFPDIRALSLFNVAGYGITYPLVQDQPPVAAAIKTALASPYYLSTISQPNPTPTPITKRGDLNRDGKIDIFDYNLLVTDFGKTGSNLIGDIDNNNKVDIFDYNILIANYGK